MHHTFFLYFLHICNAYLPITVFYTSFTRIRNLFKLKVKSYFRKFVLFFYFSKDPKNIMILFLTNFVSINTKWANIRSRYFLRIKCLESTQICRNHETTTSTFIQSNISKPKKWLNLLLFSNKLKIGLEWSKYVMFSKQMNGVCSNILLRDKTTF